MPTGSARPTRSTPTGPVGHIREAPSRPCSEQVWFSGVHSDVGGGYPEHDLRDITLLWMMGCARDCGLAFYPTAFDQHPPGAAPPAPEEETLATQTQVYPDAFGKQHQTRTGIYRLITRYIRQPGATDPDTEYVASSALTRSRALTPCWARPARVSAAPGHTGLVPE